MYNPFSLEGKTILVTGASSGIGRQCAIDCSKMGARVVLVARNVDRLKGTISEMEGANHRYYEYDLNNIDGIKDLSSTIVSENGKLDGIVHAAGIEITKPIKLLNGSDYEHLFRVNTVSGFELVRNLTSLKNFNKRGGVIFIASICAEIARGGVAAYSASKGAMVSAARVMAIELAKREIRVNCISPGTILTPLMKEFLSTLSDEERNARVGGFPLGLGQLTDISSTVIFLLSDASRWITGQNIIVDGGFTAK
jgi:NAD(P)-dependent dehydrogenase (short-subunit alcohol dehydrogenase family)